MEGKQLELFEGVEYNGDASPDDTVVSGSLIIVGTI